MALLVRCLECDFQYEGEKCPRCSDPVGYTALILGRKFYPVHYEHWEEVGCCDVHKRIVCCMVEELPDIYVVRGSQMYRLLWPELPPTDSAKTPLR